MRSAALSPLRTPAGRTRPPARNGFRFLGLHGRWAGSDRCGGVPSVPAHRAVVIINSSARLVCLVQVDEVGGGDLRRVVDFRGASGAEMQGWAAVDGLLSASMGTAEPAGSLGPRLECRRGGGGDRVGESLGSRSVSGGRRACHVAAVGELAGLGGQPRQRQVVRNAGSRVLIGRVKRGCRG